MKKISIIGLGHIGQLLAQKLRSDFEVVGTVSSQDKNIQSVSHYLYRLGETIPTELDSEITILTIPPKHFDLNNLPQFKTNWLIYTSSISVFGQKQGVVNEISTPHPDHEEGAKLLQIEKWIQSYPQWTILRLGGLIGENRHPGKYLAGKKELSSPHAPVNLVHHDDVVSCLQKIIQLQKTNEIYHCVSDEHHSKKEFYEAYSKKHQLLLPEFKDEKTENDRLVLNDKIKQHLKIEFTYSELIEKFP